MPDSSSKVNSVSKPSVGDSRTAFDGEYASPDKYWEQRLGRTFDLTDAGYGLLGAQFNLVLYAARLRSLERGLRATGSSIEGQSVLDVGCGTGFYTDVCLRSGAAFYTGIDITDISVTRLKGRYPAFRFIRADVGSEAFELKDQFDLIIAGDVLFHIVDDTRFENAIRNISRCLRPGGRLALSDVLSIDTIQSEAHCRFRALKIYKQALAKNLIAVERVEPIFAALQPPAYVPGTSIGWRAYALVWRLGLMRLAGHQWFDGWVPRWLDWLDQTILLRRSGVWTPNSKWLLAIKSDA
jgi:SAM-dependent methyltransferase